MFNKMIKILLIFCFIINISGIVYAETKDPVYDLGNGYTAVRNDIFDKLVENEKLLDLVKEERDYYKKTLDEYIKLAEQRDKIQSERIAILKDTINIKNSIIEHKDDNLQNWENLYNIKTEENKRLMYSSLMDKLLIVALGAYAVDNLEDSTDQVVVGGLSLYLLLR
jgi:hypothetical protein